MIDTKDIKKSGILDDPKYDRLIQNIDFIAQQAGLGGNPQFIWESLTGNFTLSKKEQGYLADIKVNAKDNIYGMVYENKVIQTNKLMAITGALVRNFVDARIIHKSDILQAFSDKTPLSGTVLVVPNFYTAKAPYIATDYQKDAITDFLYKQMNRGTQVILQVTSLANLKQTYGEEIIDFLVKYYIKN